jgi:hypothetical protein
VENELEVWRYVYRQQDALASVLGEEAKRGRLREQDILEQVRPRVLVRERQERLSDLHHRLGEQSRKVGFNSKRQGPHEPSSLQVSGLRLNSPLDLSLVVQGGGLAIVAYAIHLLAHVMKDPESVGAWLPRVVKGFRIGTREAKLANQPTRSSLDREEYEEILVNAALEIEAASEGGLRVLHPVSIETEGAGDTPDDIMGEFYD